MDGFPSGQRGQTVNLLQIASVVRIHHHPFDTIAEEICLANLDVIVYHNKGCKTSYPLWICRRGGTGRRTGLKILRDLYSRTGSIPVAGIKFQRKKR